MTSLDDLCDRLGVLGIHEGFPNDRRALAGHLFAWGVSEVDLDLISQQVHRSVDSEASAIRVIAAVLSDRKRLEDRLTDLRRIDAMRRAESRPRGDAPVKLGPMPADDPQEWEKDREAMMVWSWARSGWDHGTISKELGIPLPKIPDLAKRGEKAATRFAGAPPTPQPVNRKEALRAEKDETERRRTFRDSMKRDGRLPA